MRSRERLDTVALAPGALGRSEAREAALARSDTFAAPGAANGSSAAPRGKDGEPPAGDVTYGKQLGRFGTMLRVNEELRLEKQKKAGKGKKGGMDEEAQPTALVRAGRSRPAGSGCSRRACRPRRSRSVGCLLPRRPRAGLGPTLVAPRCALQELARSQTIRKGPGGLVTREDQEEGQVVGGVYSKYIKSYGVLSFIRCGPGGAARRRGRLWQRVHQIVRRAVLCQVRSAALLPVLLHLSGLMSCCVFLLLLLCICYAVLCFCLLCRPLHLAALVRCCVVLHCGMPCMSLFRYAMMRCACSVHVPAVRCCVALQPSPAGMAAARAPDPSALSRAHAHR